MKQGPIHSTQSPIKYIAPFRGQYDFDTNLTHRKSSTAEIHNHEIRDRCLCEELDHSRNLDNKAMLIVGGCACATIVSAAIGSLLKIYLQNKR